MNVGPAPAIRSLDPKPLGAGLLIGAVIATLVTFRVAGGPSTASARTVRGTVDRVNGPGDATSIDGEGYVFEGRPWQDLRGTWHEDGAPECLPPLSSGAEVEFGLINLRAGDETPGYPNYVVWVRCLSAPQEADP